MLCFYRFCIILVGAVGCVTTLGAQPHGLLPGTDQECVVAGQIIADTLDTLASPSKVEAALYLAFDLAHHHLIGPFERDSLLAVHHADSTTTIMDAANAIGCPNILFATVRRFARLVRADIQIVGGSSIPKQHSGVGYASITFARSDSELIADPALLQATQRALTQILEPNPQYDTLQGALRVVPAELITVSGIEFVDTTTQEQWQLFKERTISSFDLVQTIVGALQQVDTLVTVDIETRDEMFAKAGFHLVENDNPTSQTEMRVLRGFDIGRMIGGRLSRTEHGAVLTLWNAILLPDGRYQVLESANAMLKDDTKFALRHAAVSAVTSLFGGAIAAPSPER